MIGRLAVWDATMGEACGVWWDKVDEPGILDTARHNGWSG
jgi:hypothetical protein